MLWPNKNFTLVVVIAPLCPHRSCWFWFCTMFNIYRNVFLSSKNNLIGQNHSLSDFHQLIGKSSQTNSSSPLPLNIIWKTRGKGPSFLEFVIKISLYRFVIKLKTVYCFGWLPWTSTRSSHGEVFLEINLNQKTLKFYTSWVHCKKNVFMKWGKSHFIFSYLFCYLYKKLKIVYTTEKPLTKRNC